MKYLSRILAIFLCVTMIPISYVAQAAESDSFYEGFDGYATNDAPAEINVNTNTYYIKEYAEGKKGLCIALGKQQTTVQFPIGIQGSFCLQFDIACTPAAADGSLTIQDNKSKAEILKFYSDNRITATDGKPLFGYGETMGRIAIVYDAQKASCDIYRDGRLFESNYRFSSGALTAIESLSFSFFSETPGNEIIIDNLYVTSGAKVPKTMPRSEYNDEVMDEPTFTHDIKLGTRVIMNCDFETALPLSVYQNGSTLERIEEDGNTAMLFERGNTGDFHLNAMSLNVLTDCVVIEFDIKILDPMSMVNFMCLDANTVTQTCARLLSGGMLTMGSQSVKLNTDTWYRFSMMINCYDRTIDYYINGEKKDSAEIQSANFVVGSRPNVFRYHVPPASSASENPVKFLTDNLRIYEGNEPREDLGDVKNEIILTGKTVLPSESSTKKQMVGYYSVHARSGVAYANGTKTVLENKPYEKDGKTYVNAAELAAVFGLDGDFSGDVTVGDFAAASKLVLTAVPNSINDGLYIFGKSSFKIPDNEEDVDKLNDYLFFQRPTPEQVTELFNSSPVKGVHPRIQATADDFARIREQVKTDSYMKLWSERIIRAADALFTKDPVVYELRDGVRLLYVSRDVLNNMYTLGMAYQLTGDKKYAERAWLDLEAVCVKFFDWHPSHDIDCAEMCAAVAIGYDWMYDAFSDEQRAAIENGLYQKGLYEVTLGYQSSSSAMQGIVTWGGQNRCLVTNGGAVMAALAVMDVYPEETAFIVSCAARAVEPVIKCFAPDGAYWEGPSYWEYTMQYFAKLGSSLDSVLDTTFGLEYVQGLSITTDYELHMQTTNGTYIYGDGSSAKIYVPEMLWLAEKYDRKDNASVVMKKINGNFSGGEDLALALLWYDITTEHSDIKMPTHAIFEKEDTMVIRENWEDDSTYVGIHAGHSHDQLDGGSFIYENSGVRWAIDPGSGNYNQVGYFDSAPDGRKWRIYYCRAESHNAIVVNPSELPDHRLPSYAKLELKEVKDRGAIAVVDMTDLLYDVSSARRGFMFTDNRQSLVIRDEVNVTKESDVYWFMQTRADVAVDETGATLISDGKELRLDFLASHGATIQVGQSKPLPTSPIEENDRYGDFNRIVIKTHGSGAMDLTVKLTPANIDSTPISDYNKSIDLWSIPDGPIPQAPKLDSVTVGGVDMPTDKRDIVYNYVEGSLSAVPEITAYSAVHSVAVERSSSLSEPSYITVTDANDPANKFTYRVHMNPLKKPVEFEGLTSIPIVAVEASDEPQPENNALNVIDGDLGTRWSAEGPGRTITVDVGKIMTLDKVAIAFYDGTLRTTNITIQVSKDGYEFEDVFKGKSSGKTDNHEFYDLLGKEARYVRLLCDGASTSNWNSITEIVVAQNK